MGGRGNRILEIDRLRAIAILMTIYCHLSQVYPWGFTSYPYLLSNTGTGVHLFFVISGYVVSSALYRVVAPISLHSGTMIVEILLRFYKRRFFRIILLSWVWLGVFIAVSAIFTGPPFPPLDSSLVQEAIAIVSLHYNVPSTLPAAPRLTLFWTLSVEEQFYIVYPVVFVMMIARRAALRWLVTLLAIGAGIDLLLLLFRAEGFIPPFLAILTGCLLYFWQRQWAGTIILRRTGLSIALVSIVSVALIYGLAVQSDLLPPTTYVGLRYLYIIAFAGTLVLIAALDQDVMFSIWPLNRILEYIGSRSYGLYLIHIPVFWTNQRLWAAALGTDAMRGYETAIMASALAAALAVSELSFRYIEGPLVKIATARAPQRATHGAAHAANAVG